MKYFVHYEWLNDSLIQFRQQYSIVLNFCYALLLLFFLFCTLLYFKIIVFSYSAIQPQVC